MTMDNRSWAQSERPGESLQRAVTEARKQVRKWPRWILDAAGVYDELKGK